MQVTETLNTGLKRKLSVTIPATDLVSRQNAKLDEMKSRAQIKGFRPGKVPVSHLKKTYGRSIMSEVMQDAINAGVQDALTEREERAATQPKIDIGEDQSMINNVLEGTADLAFEVDYEVLPTFELMDFKKVSVEKPVVAITDEDVEKEANRFYLNNRPYEDKGDDAVVADGDRLGIKFEGKIKGEPFEGGSADHAHIIVGSGEFIPGFEEQLIGVKKGESRDVKVKFPKDYANEDLAGKEAVFDVTVLHIDGPTTSSKLDDEFAKGLGMEDLAALREAIKGQIAGALDSMARQRMKRQILDALDDAHKFDVPEALVESEFESIWQRIVHEIEQHGRSFEDEGTTEEKAKEQYRKIAERRVRLGLVIAEIGNQNKVEVTEEEHQQALIAEVRRFPGQEQQVYDYYLKNQQALAGLRAPIFENKVVDFIAELAKKTDKAMTREVLAKLIQADEEDNEVPEEHHH